MKTGKRDRYESEEDEEEEEEEEEEESNEEEESKVKVIEKFDPNIITVKVQIADFGSYLVKFMKIDREIELRWLMIHYCDNTGLDYNNANFMFNGAICKDSDTPLKLSMVNQDTIFVVARSSNQGVSGFSPFWYKTLCIRMHKRSDTFVRVTWNEPLLPQIKRYLSDGGNGKHGSTCFVYKGQKLGDFTQVNFFLIEDGDIIDAFNFDDNRSSLSIVNPIAPPPPTSKGNQDINKSGPRVNVPGTSGTCSRPRETQPHSNPPAVQTTTPWHPHLPPPAFMYYTGPPFPSTKQVPH